MKRLLATLSVMSVMLVAVPVVMARESQPTMTPVQSGDEFDREVKDIGQELDKEAQNRYVDVEVPDKIASEAEDMVGKDKNISGVSVSEEDKTVQVSYQLHAKLFGFISLPYELQAKVDAKNKTVQANGPWWLIFATDNRSEVQQALEKDTSLTQATNQGQVLSRVLEILKSLAGK